MPVKEFVGMPAVIGLGRGSSTKAYMEIARKYFVSGLVQGVGFRFFVQRSAAKHQVRGYVKNLKDGRVEAYAEGFPSAIKDFYEDLLTGPVYSRVQEVEEIVIEPQGAYSAFFVER